MEKLNSILEYFKNINDEKIVDILIAIIVVVVFCVFSSLVAYIIIKLFMLKEKNKKKIKSNAFYIPLRILFIAMGIYIAAIILQLPTNVMEIWKKIFKIIVICITAKALVNLVDPKSEIANKLRKKEESNEEKTNAKFTGRILKYIIYIVAIFFILLEFNYDISGLLTGLGIVSAAVALAAQDVVKSLLAGMSIMTDKPFLVGDWVVVGTTEGSVIDISFRSTKIRTSDSTLVTIPNSVITNNSIINWSRLEKRRYIQNVKLPLETNSETLERIVGRLKFVFQTNEKIIQDPINVHFTSIDPDGINLQIYFFTEIIEYVPFLEFKQEVNEQILKILESENVKIAYPGQNVYVTYKDENCENDKKKKVQRVQKMKKE